MKIAHQVSSSETVSITIRNRLSELEFVLRNLEQFSEAVQLEPGVRYSARLVLEELITNVLKYGYSDAEEHIITIRFSRNEEELAIIIEDDSREFNPADRKIVQHGRRLKEKAKGGQGLRLVRSLVDEMHYVRKRGKNILTIKKKLVPNG